MSKATTFDQLKKLANRTGQEIQRIDAKVDAIVVPTKVSDLNNDSGFQTAGQVTAAVQSGIAASGHAHFEKVATVPTVADAQENVMYLVKNTKTGHYDIYAKVAGAAEGEFTMEQLDDTTVDLSGYIETEEGKGLSANDYDDAAKAKLDALEFATDAEVDAALTAAFGAAQE